MEAWTDKFVQLLTFEFKPTQTEVLAYSRRTLDQEMQKNLFNDIHLLTIAYSLMICFLSFTLGKPPSKVHNRVLISFVNIVWLLVATGAAYGLLMWLGVPFNPSLSLVRVLIFCYYSLELYLTYPESSPIIRSFILLGIGNSA